MNPFELTKDPDSGLPIVRVKRGFVVLTKEEGERVSERIKEILDENEKLRAERDYLIMNSNPTAYELRRVRAAWMEDRETNAKLRELCEDMYAYARTLGYDHPFLRELGIEAGEDDPCTATRRVVSHGDYGRCNCSACNWSIDPYDAYCRRCGARFTATEYRYAGDGQ